MSKLSEHHDLSLKILVSRSLPNLPWSFDVDREQIAQERVLWNSLTPEEKLAEQQFLSSFWGHKGALRKITINPNWGSWTENCPAEIVVPDKAFGVPSQDYRPHLKGLPALDSATEKVKTCIEWLWSLGYQVIDIHENTVSILVDKSRLLQESERLFSLMSKTEAYVNLTLKATYEPKSGTSLLILQL